MTSTKGRLEDKLEKLRADVKEGRSYEALQIYKTLAFRHKDESRTIYASGACAMLENGQPTCGAELAALLVKLYVESHTKVSEDSIQSIMKVANTFPPLAPGEQAKVSFLKSAVKWSAAEGSNKSGEPVLLSTLAKAFADIEDFNASQKYYLKSDDPIGFAAMLRNWAGRGYPAEADLYLARGVLQLLSLSNLKNANLLFSEILRYVPAAQRTPLLNFVGFLLKTLEHDALPLFELLRKKYATSIRRDPMFNKLLNQIAEVFYKVKPAGSAHPPANIPNFFSNLLQGFLQPTDTGEQAVVPARPEDVD